MFMPPSRVKLCETLVQTESRSGLFLALQQEVHACQGSSSCLSTSFISSHLFRHPLLLASHVSQGSAQSFARPCSIPLIIAPNALDDAVGSPLCLVSVVSASASARALIYIPACPNFLHTCWILFCSCRTDKTTHALFAY
jgi:hypothetical protein